MVQHEDFSAHLSVAGATVLRESLAADGELRGAFSDNIVGDS